MIGQSIHELKYINYAEINEINSVDISRYQTCRGYKNREYILRIFDLVMDKCNESEEREDAINDGLWDELYHQGTLYSATPIALYYFLKKYSYKDISKIPDAKRFVDLLNNSGTKNIFLFEEEINLNLKGLLSIFKIEDVLNNFGLYKL